MSSFKLLIKKSTADSDNFATANFEIIQEKCVHVIVIL